ncbi:MAG: YihY/virulence factor BrkB family protein [Eubacteriales bacterium]|nr:YihY/virulence factor BrkB family protein [Eubacteriales bacterium]
MRLILSSICITKKFLGDEMPVFAASAAFWMLISVVPFLMVIITAVQFIPGLDRSSVEELLYSAAPNMPQINELIHSVLDNLYISAPAAVISITAVMAVWSASTGVYAIERGIMKIYGEGQDTSYPVKRLRALWFTFLFLILFLLTLIVLIFGRVLERAAHTLLPGLAALISRIMDVRALAAPAILFMAFVLIYIAMPGSSRKIRHHWPGAVFATVFWTVLSYLFSIYFTYFRNISYMYGSLGAIVLLMFWLFTVICILFFGAEINLFCATLRELKETK